MSQTYAEKASELATVGAQPMLEQVPELAGTITLFVWGEGVSPDPHAVVSARNSRLSLPALLRACEQTVRLLGSLTTAISERLAGADEYAATLAKEIDERHQAIQKLQARAAEAQGGSSPPGPVPVPPGD
jgi:hypothetical protein